MFFFLGDLVQMLDLECSAVGEAIVSSQNTVHGKEIICRVGFLSWSLKFYIPSDRGQSIQPTQGGREKQFRCLARAASTQEGRKATFQ